MKVMASAPGKLMLFGEHAVVYGYPCIVTAVDQRMRVTVKPNGEGELHVSAPQLGLEEYRKKIELLGKQDVPKQVRFIEQLVKNYYEKHGWRQGIRVITESEFLDSFGFGSSAAVTVALGRALGEFFGKRLTKKELFKMCFQAVLDVQGVGSGFDVAAAIYGGTLYYVSPGKVVKQLRNGHLPLVVGYTGIKADTPTLVRMVEGLRLKNKKKIDEIFQLIGEIVDQARQGMKQRNWVMVGRLMKKNQKLLRQLQVSSVELEKLIEATEKAGAYGAKLSGAGGGDCMIALRPAQDKLIQKKIEKAIGVAGGKLMRVELNAEGVKLEK